MEIVRQRRKRLLAWILTLVLCVGMWQGNVQAEGEDGGDGAITPTETMTTEGVSEATEPEKIGYSDNIIVEGDVESTTIISLIGAELSITQDFTKEILVDSDAEEFKITATTNNYEHKLISWELTGSGGTSELNETGTDKTIKRNKENRWSSYDYGLYVNWGKIIEIRDEDGNELGVCFQDSFEEEASAVMITLPENFLECKEGLFFSGWVGDIISGSIEGNIYTADFNKLKSIYHREVLCKQFDSNIIPGSGTYLLNGNFEYVLGSGSWKVGNDGYSYSGDQVVYLPADGNYTFTSQEQ